MKRQKSFQNDLPTLYLVATPIGNLEDMTFRAVNILKSVDIIYAEDTRVSHKLLSHYDISKPLKTYHDFNKEVKSNEILQHLREHQNVALISDAGYPLISDPGYFLIREVIEEDFNVVSIPGANALLTGLVVSGLPPQPFTFYGFLDNKEGKRKKQLMELKDKTETLIFYESPHRVTKTIQNIHQVFGLRDVVIARELTKKFEEVIRGTSESLKDLEELKGEMVLMVAGNKNSIEELDMSILEEVKMNIENGLSSKDAIKEVARRRNLTKNDVYQEYHNADMTDERRQ
ncbi:MAG: 16S rRNA (cytidine(1402)-2'-O)-methyltransferase [Bacilli bacterium]|nr:16S rRNA (cytidine(1402)-2'-O)-methyltransferase [Bacilli bacterium]